MSDSIKINYAHKVTQCAKDFIQIHIRKLNCAKYRQQQQHIYVDRTQIRPNCQN